MFFRQAQAVGGLIFRCEVCPSSYCEDHLPMEAELIGHCARFEELGMRHPDQARGRVLRARDEREACDTPTRQEGES